MGSTWLHRLGAHNDKSALKHFKLLPNFNLLRNPGVFSRDTPALILKVHTTQKWLCEFIITQIKFNFKRYPLIEKSQ